MGHRVLFGECSLALLPIICLQPLGFLGLCAQSPFPELSLVQEKLLRPGQATSDNPSEDKGQVPRQGRGSTWEGPLGLADPQPGPWCPVNSPASWKRMTEPWVTASVPRSDPPPASAELF